MAKEGAVALARISFGLRVGVLGDDDLDWDFEGIVNFKDVYIRLGSCWADQLILLFQI